MTNGRSLFLAVVLGLAALAAALRSIRGGEGSAASGTLVLTADSLSRPSPRGSPRTAPELPAKRSIVVYVAGEVRRPGVYGFNPGERAEVAVRAAGGPTGKADLVAVNLAEILQDGEEIAVPMRGNQEEGVLPTRKGRSALARGAHRRKRRKANVAAASEDANEQVHINTAGEDDLRALPGVGESLAARIIAYRRVNGPFQVLDDLRDVGGITEGKFERMAPYVLIP